MTAETSAGTSRLGMATGQSQNADLRRIADSIPQSKDKFDDVYLAVATLFELQNKAFSKHERELAADILKHLSKDVEMSIRIALAERLADAEDLLELRKAKRAEGGKRTVPLAKVKRKLGLR